MLSWAQNSGLEHIFFFVLDCLSEYQTKEIIIYKELERMLI